MAIATWIGGLILGYTFLGMFQGYFSIPANYLGQMISWIKYPLYVIDQNLFPVMPQLYYIYGAVIFFFVFKIIMKTFVNK